MAANENLVWKRVGRRVVFESPILTLTQAPHVHPSGRELDFVLIESGDWVNVVPLLAGGDSPDGREHFVMVRQYRPGAGRVSLEFPGGFVDAGEDPQHAAGRELAEETGYSAGKLEKIGQINPNPAILTNQMHTFLATGLEQLGAMKLDTNEVLEYELVPVDDVLSGKNPDFFVNGIMLVVLQWFEFWRARNGS